MVPAPPRPLARGVGVILAATYGWWAVSLPPFSARATLAVLVAGATAIVLGRLRRQRPPGRPTSGVGWWALVATAAVTWQLAAYLQHPRAEHPTLSSLANALLDTQPARVAAFVLWVVLAVELARR